MSVIAQIQLRRGTAEEWAAANPVLALGEPGWDSTNDRFKVGNGYAAWDALPVISGIGPAGADGVTAHSDLTELAYDDAGHTGFAEAVHTHAATDVTGTAMTLASDDTITGTKTFPSDNTHAPVFTGDSTGPSAAFKLVDEAGGTPHTMQVVGCAGGADGNTSILNPGSMVSTGGTGTLAALGTGLLKNETTTGVLSIATASDYVAPALLAAMREPTGFADRTKSTITFTVAGSGAGQTRVFDIAHAVDATFDIYSGGVKYSKTHDTVSIPDVTGLYYVYYSTAGVLTCSVVNTAWDIKSANVPVATVYWNADLDEGLLGDERHGIQMDGMTHEYLHETKGAAYAFGLGGTFGAAGATLSISSGEWYDDDIEWKNASPLTQCRVLYRDAAGKWKWTAAQNGYYSLSGASTPAYDNGSGTLASVGVTKFSHSWVFTTNDPVCPIYVVMGQAEYNTAALAKAVGPDSLSLGTLPVAEMLLLYRVTWQRDSAVIKSPTTADYRRLSGGPVSNYTPTDHAGLQHLDAATSGHTGFALTGDIPTVDATRSWTTKQTFPTDGTNCPAFEGSSDDEKPAFSIRNYSPPESYDYDTTLDVVGTGGGRCILHSGLVFTDTNIINVTFGGTGAATLAGAGITTFVGTPWNGVGLTGDTTQQTLLATGHAAGMYRITVYGRCTTAGATGSATTVYCTYNDGATANIVLGCLTQSGLLSEYFGLATTSSIRAGTYDFYSSGNAAITCRNDNGIYNTNPVFNIRARLEYLGA